MGDLFLLNSLDDPAARVYALSIVRPIGSKHETTFDRDLIHELAVGVGIEHAHQSGSHCARLTKEVLQLLKGETTVLEVRVHCRRPG